MGGRTHGRRRPNRESWESSPGIRSPPECTRLQRVALRFDSNDPLPAASDERPHPESSPLAPGPVALRLTLASPLAAQEAERDPFDLARFAPADAFLVTGSEHNPDRQFLTDHWNRVWQTLAESEVPDDVLELLSTFSSEDERQEMQRVFDRFSTLLGAVDWAGLGSGETLFVERLLEPMRFGSGSFLGGQPELALIVRTDEERTGVNSAALAAVLGGILDEINRAAGTEVELVKEVRGELTSAVLDIGAFDPDAPALSFAVSSSGDLLLLTFGHSLRHDVAALIAGAADAKPITATPRFQEAFAAVPAPGDSYVYFDFQNLEDDLGDVIGGALDLASGELDGGGSEVEAVVAVADRLLGILDAFDWSATTSYTKGYSVYGTTLTKLSPRAPKNPIYPVLTGGSTVGDFARYLPVETTSFSVNGGLDLGALYTFIEGTVLAAGAPGEEAVDAWESFQEEQGFDLREDYLRWIDGGGVNATFTDEGGEHWISMMKVSDEEAARETIDTVVEAIPAAFEFLAAQGNPMVGMFEPMFEPSEHADLAGFTRMSLPMAPGEAMLFGVHDGWVVFGSSEDAVLLSRSTAAGTHANVTKNEALMKRAIVPGKDEVASSVIYTDHTGTAEEIAMGLSSIAMMGGMVTAQIPEPEAQKVMRSVFGILGSLAPVVEAIDFYVATSTTTTFDGKTWTMRTVTHYTGPE